MVARGISKSELVSRVREFLEGLGREEIKQLSRGEFARAVGADPLSITCEYKWELARILCTTSSNYHTGRSVSCWL